MKKENYWLHVLARMSSPVCFIVADDERELAWWNGSPSRHFPGYMQPRKARYWAVKRLYERDMVETTEWWGGTNMKKLILKKCHRNDFRPLLEQRKREMRAASSLDAETKDEVKK